MIQFIPFQPEFRQAIPEVIGNHDYFVFREILDRIDEIILSSKIEQQIVQFAIVQTAKERRSAAEKKGKKFEELSYKTRLRVQAEARLSLRCAIARNLTGESFRDFSCRLADSPILHKFCLIDRIDIIKVPSKSRLQRNEMKYPEDLIRDLVFQLNQAASQEIAGKNPLNLREQISLSDYYVDATCVDADIHFPIDWLLLRDATRTLMKAVTLIRRAGLKNRMQSPQAFIKQMNQLCMKMTHTRRKKDSKRNRKKIFRLMKKMIKKIILHAERHLELLVNRWSETSLTRGQVNQIIQRIQNVLDQLPGAIRQAHERIIGERRVVNSEKILSLYDPDIHVIVRGKASGETEFGNTLVLAEQSDGLIVDWKLYREQAPQDSKCLIDRLEEFKERYGIYPDQVTGDRGYSSLQNERYFAGKNISNHVCPKSVKALREQLQNETFRNNQTRRAQTEGRIGIIQNKFLGKPLRSKGFLSRETHTSWAVLAHNLWVLARMPTAEEEKLKLRLAA